MRADLDQPKFNYSVFHEASYWAKRAGKMLHEWREIPEWSRADFIATCIVEDSTDFISANRDKMKIEWFVGKIDEDSIKEAIQSVEDFFDG